MLKREKYLSRIRGFYHDDDVIKILVGIRRCGKSVILNQIIDELKEENVRDDHIIYINFEYIEFEELKDYKKLNNYVKSLIKDKKMYYLFLDEVQLVDKFENVVNSLRASLNNLSIFITGSNSRLLSNELSTILSGRYVSFKIKPLSFKEYIELTGNNPYDESIFFEYQKWGGLPRVYNFSNDNDRKDYLKDVFDTIILRDVISRFNLKNIPLFNLMLEYIIDTTGREFSAENIYKYLKTNGNETSTKTIYEYLDALCKSFIITKVYRKDVHGKLIFKTLNKYYMVDLGITTILHSSDIPNAFSLENIVYNDLIVKGYDVFIGKTKKGEIDFIASKFDEIKYIQVAAYLSNDETIEREFSAFNVIDDNYPKYVISLDKDNYSRNGIIHLNIIDFLMNDDF